jgi:hypothetical protein
MYLMQHRDGARNGFQPFGRKLQLRLPLKAPPQGLQEGEIVPRGGGARGCCSLCLSDTLQQPSAHTHALI